MRPHKKLQVWNRAIDFVTRIYGITTKFPEIEKFGLISQMRRAAVSIPSNIAEGAGRQSKREFRQFLSIAQGSSAELETQLIISRNLEFLQDEADELLEELDHISMMLNGLIRSLRIK